MSIGTSAAVGIGIAGALGAGATLASGAIQSNASNTATDRAIAAQREFAQLSLAQQQKYYDQARADLEPFRQSQLKAVGQLEGFSDANNPIYQQQRTQATNAIQQQLAAQGLLRSKNQTDLLTNLELGLGQQRLGVLQQLAGQGAAQQQAGLAFNQGNSVANIYQGLGSSLAGLQGQNALQQGQIASGVVTGLGNIFQGGLGQYYQNNQNQNFLNQLLQRQQGGGGFGGFSDNGVNPLFGRIV